MDKPYNRKRSGLFTASKVLLIARIALSAIEILSLVLIFAIVLFACLGTLVGYLAYDNSGLDYDMEYEIIYSIFAFAIVGLAFLLSIVQYGVVIVMNAIILKKLGKATSKKKLTGWAIATIVIAVITGPSILGIASGVLLMCLPESDFTSSDNNTRDHESNHHIEFETDF